MVHGPLPPTRRRGGQSSDDSQTSCPAHWPAVKAFALQGNWAEAEKQFWAQRDPIKRLAGHLVGQQLASEAELKAIEKEIDAHVVDCVEFALAAPEPDPAELTRYIWAED